MHFKQRIGVGKCALHTAQYTFNTFYELIILIEREHCRSILVWINFYLKKGLCEIRAKWVSESIIKAS